VRLCAGVGGLVAVSKMICGLIKAAVSWYCCSSSDSSRSHKTSQVIKETIDVGQQQQSATLLPAERSALLK